MRDTGDMMEDALSEDTMMECGGDETVLDDLVDLTTEISHTTPTIRDAAERLLTLLGVEDDQDDYLSSSEDEGVELDEDSEEDEEEPENTRLLHQLAASLAEELKYSQKQNDSLNSSRFGIHQRGANKLFSEPSKECSNDHVQSMEVASDVSYQDDAKNHKFASNYVEQTVECKSTIGRSFYGDSNSLSNPSSISPRKFRSETRLRLVNDERDEEKTVLNDEATEISGSWTAGWDACAAEAIRYLVEEEGLSPNHPTVLAMKGHLEIQRERALTQYAM